MTTECGTCETCRHWTMDEATIFPDGRVYLNVREHGRRVCGAIAGSEEGLKPGDLARASDSEGYSAWLETAPTFGCVLHEAVVFPPAPVVEEPPGRECLVCGGRGCDDPEGCVYPAPT